MQFVTDTNFTSKTILLRLDLDVPLKDGQITDDTRLRNTLPTIEYLQNQKAKIIITGHLGRPRKDFSDLEKYKLDPVARFFVSVGLSVKKLDDCIGPDVNETVEKMTINETIILENLRFHLEEENNNPEFAQQLAKLADVYVNDAFAAYRPHASVVGLAKLLPTYFGFQFQKELDNLSKVLKNPKRPVVFIIGGVKKEKLELLPDIAKIADQTLVSHPNCPPGQKTICPEDHMDNLDIGPKTIAKFQNIIKSAGTIIWAGPVGKFEEEKYQQGTKQIGQTIIDNKDAFRVAGGGDTEEALKKFGFYNEIDFVSTGGGAMLYYLSKGTLPILETLKQT